MKKIVLILALFVALVVPSATKADGGIMPRPGYWIAETSQKAVIVFEKNTETMVLSTTFQGDAKEFSWIVPTPAKPEVNKGTFGIFEALQDLTNVYSSRDLNFASPLGVGSIPEKQAVTVVEQKKIDVYDISVLEATDKEALYNWLNENGYTYPDYGKTVLDDYIRNGWYFTAVKINPEDSDVAGERLKTGTITPLKFVFPTDKIVYPLKISSITMDDPTKNAPTPATPPVGIIEDTTADSSRNVVPPPITPNNYVNVQLYIFADHKKKADGFNENYANWVDAKTIKELGTDDNGNAWYTPSGKEMYLTSLSRNMNTRDMRNDVFPTNADNNRTNPPSQFWVNLFAAILIILLVLFSPFGLFFLIFMLLFIFVKSRAVKILSLVIQGLLVLCGVITSIIIAIAMSDGTFNDLTPALIAVLIMTIIGITGIILEIVLGKRKKIL